MIIVRVPYRVSFVGGGTDFPKYYNKYNGNVVGTTINKYCYVTIRKISNIFNYRYRIVWSKNEIENEIKNIKNPIVNEVLKYFNLKDKVEIHYQSELPKNSGIGSSSAFCVGVIQAVSEFKNLKLSKKEIANIAIKIEQKKLKEYCGSQDQIWSSFGGFKKIEFSKNNFKLNEIKISSKRKKKLEENLLLMFTEYQRYSKNIEKKKDERINQNKNILDRIKILTIDFHKFLESKKKIHKFGDYLNQYWDLKKKLSNNVTNNHINNLYNKILKNGALGAKLIGSGSGGFFLIYCDKPKQHRLLKTMKKNNFLNFKFCNHGAQIIYKDDLS